MTDPRHSSVPNRIGEFEIRSLLGSGGSGDVFEATWGPRRVALKVLRSDLLPNEAERNRFYSEAQILSELGHPGIVKILSYGSLDDGRPYLVMELLEGVPLADFVTARTLSSEQALSFFAQISDAVAAIHARGLIHRDLKPENVLVAGGDYAVLLDFGIAKGIDAPASTTTQEGGVRGTPAYMAPERFFGQPASVASDTYEIAVLLYSMLVGALPWDSGHDPEERLNPKRPSERGVALNADLEATLMRALSTRPEARHASVFELAEAVRSSVGPAMASPRDRQTAALDSGRQTPAATPHKHHASVVSTGPSMQAPTAASSRRSRWPLFAAVGLIAAAALATALVFALGSGDGESSDVGKAGEVASGEVENQEPEMPSGAAATVETPTREGDDTGLARAAAHHPADTAVLIGVRVREIRQSAAFASVFNEEKTREPLATALRSMAACDVDFVDDLDWLTVGVVGGARDEADFIVTGAFTRDSIESCLAKAGTSIGAGSKLARDGAVTTIEDGAALTAMIWLRDNSVMLSTRSSADSKWLRARKKESDSIISKKTPLSSALSETNTMASLWLVGRAEALNVGKELEGVAVPELLRGTIEASETLGLEARLFYPDDKLAASAHAALEEQFESVSKDPLVSGLFDTITAKKDNRSVAVSIQIGQAGTTMVASAIVSALRSRQ